MRNIVFTIAVFFFTTSVFSQEDIFEMSRKGDVKAIKVVLKKDVTLLNSKNKSGFTPLILASYRNNIDLVSFLIEQGADVNILSEMGTALMAATFKGNVKVVKILLENGANPNKIDPKGTTALHYACLSQNIKIVELIKTKNPKIDLKDDKGKTALDYAIELENIEIIKLLKN